MHKYWTDDSKDLRASKFEDTFCAFLTMEHEMESLSSLGVRGTCTSAFGRCPICSYGPEGIEQGLVWFIDHHDA